ncbi:MAG: allophanate hydrolase [Pseudonocardiales bacterium]|nr:allophanate hydrolase [Pseudonocardiales bacterium]
MTPIGNVTQPALMALAAARKVMQPVFTAVFADRWVRSALQTASVSDGIESPLLGMAFAVKDNIDVQGVPTTGACPSITAPALRSAASVQRLMSAGAIPIAKTNMDQFATGLVGTRSPYGACHSVASVAHVSGGSSSGSALAVALGVVDLALGTDTAGSGRVPAAFNGLVGMKPSRGLISNQGLMPASPSLDCITTFSRTVALARSAFETLIAPDQDDPYSRPMPTTAPAGVAERMQVIGVPSALLDLDEPHQQAWQEAVAHAATVARIVQVDVEPLLAAARLLYSMPMLGERLAAFGQLLEPDGPHLDPTVRQVVLAARSATAVDVYRAQHLLAALAAQTRALFIGIDTIMLPVTPGHPTLAEAAADPTGVNSRLGTYTNMVNLLDLCAVAVPAGARPDGLPFGVQLIAPTFADRPLLQLASRWCGEPVPDPTLGAHRTLLAVAGAHLTGQPLNAALVELGGRLHCRARTAAGYRMYAVPGPIPRPGLVRTGDGPADGIELEIWHLPHQGLGLLLPTVSPPLGLGQIELDDGRWVTGFICDSLRTVSAEDITSYRGWRAYLDGHRKG